MQKYNIKPKTVYYDFKLRKTVSDKGKNTLTFRSLLEYEVYTFLYTLAGCEVLCQIPIKGESFTWIVDFMVRPTTSYGKSLLKIFRNTLNIPGDGNLYVEAKGIITQEFSDKLRACRQECPSIYKNLVAFGSTPLGVVFEDGFNVSTFPILSTNLLKNLVLECNNQVTEVIKNGRNNGSY